VRHFILLLTTAVSMLGCALMGLSADAAVAHSVVARGKATAPPQVRADSSLGRRRAAAACVPRRGRVCQASAKSQHRASRPKHPAAPPSGIVKPAKQTGAIKPTKVTAGETATTTATVRAGQIAAVLATPCENTELTPEAGNLGLIRAAVLCLVNVKRAQNGESPLRLSAQLGQAAEGHDHELISADYFAHVSPSGLTPVDRVRGTGYIPGRSVGYVIGENLAWGTYGLSTPAAIVSAWIASPGHLANILESQYTETGIGVVPQVPPSLANGSPGATYAQEFGVIVH
jgi:uncharacterized protein YkwD